MGPAPAFRVQAHKCPGTHCDFEMIERPDKDSLETYGFPTAAKRPAFLHGELPFPDPLLVQVWQKFHFVQFVARLGLEPRYSPPEGDVLPLDDLAILGPCMKGAPLRRALILAFFRLGLNFLLIEFLSGIAAV